jgi:hypothetical protein
VGSVGHNLSSVIEDIEIAERRQFHVAEGKSEQHNMYYFDFVSQKPKKR